MVVNEDNLDQERLWRPHDDRLDGPQQRRAKLWSEFMDDGYTLLELTCLIVEDKNDAGLWQFLQVIHNVLASGTMVVVKIKKRTVN